MQKKSITLLATTLLVAKLLLTPLSILAHSVGIIPYIVQKGRSGTPYVSFLLSEDSNRQGEWADFSGSGKPNRWTAAKEGYEETMGIFIGQGGDNLKYGDPIKNENIGIKTMHQKYLGKKAIKIWGKPQNFNNQEWLTYLIDVTKSVEIVGGKRATINRLNDTLNSIKNTYPNWQRFKNSAHAYTEKVAFKWFSKKDLIDAITNIKSKNKLNDKFRQVLEMKKNLSVIKGIR